MWGYRGVHGEGTIPRDIHSSSPQGQPCRLTVPPPAATTVKSPSGPSMADWETFKMNFALQGNADTVPRTRLDESPWALETAARLLLRLRAMITISDALQPFISARSSANETVRS